MLNQVEQDFIEFLARRRGRPLEQVEKAFLETKRRFPFATLRYRELMVNIHDVHRVIYDDADERDLIDSYKFHELIHLFRFISYSYPKTPARYWDAFTTFMRLLARGEFGKIRYGFGKSVRKALKRTGDCMAMGHGALARFLLDRLDGGSPIVVDYGCGLAYTAFEIGKAAAAAKIFLVDIDCLVLEFAEYRFRKHGIDVETIPVTTDNLYPSLPPHTICIASEVMEHVVRPLTVYENIVEALAPGGILCGSFEDHVREMFHVSPRLGELRKRIAQDFEPIGNACYRKR